MRSVITTMTPCFANQSTLSKAFWYKNMNNSERTPDHRPLRRVSTFAIQVILAGTLVACAESELPDNDTVTPESAAAPAAPAGRPDSGPQSNDGSNSVSYAQAIAAGDISTPDTPVIFVPPASNVPDTGAANPDTNTDTNTDTDTDTDTDSDSDSESVPETESPTPDVGSNPPQNPFAPIPDAEAEADVAANEDNDEQIDNTDDTPDVIESEPDNGANPITDEHTVATDAPDSSVSGESSTDDTVSDNAPPAAAEPDEQSPPDEYSGADESPTPTPDQTTDNASNENATDQEAAEGKTSSLKSKSHTTPGFEGEVIDGAIRVTWTADPLARGYNVYRQAQYITTVMTNEYIDTDVFDRDYYYEIQAFDYDDVLYYIATGLTVSPKTLGKNDPNEPIADANRLDDYELVFAEEFQGMTLDSSKWNTAYLWGPNLVINYEEQYYVDINRDPDFGFNPFTFDGEHMTINSIKTPPELAQKAMNQPYLSGVITSYDAFKFTYGYAETRAKVTYGRGYWPAFWLLNAYYGGYDPEIDIMEFIGDDQDVVYHTYHYYDNDGNLRSTKSKPTPGIDFTADFHTFAVEWKPGIVIYLVDGIEVHRVTDPMVSSEEMYVIANTAIGGWWAGSPDESTPFPGEYTIDYIRVYQRNTPFDDVLLNDGMSNLPFADDIPGQSSPSHRPSPEQWPEGYPNR